MCSTCSVAQLCPILWDHMDCSPPGFSVYRIFQARILECVAISSCRGSNPNLLHCKWIPTWLSGTESACNAGDVGSISGSGRSPGGRNGNRLQYSCLENPIDREAQWVTTLRVSKSCTCLNNRAHTQRLCVFPCTQNAKLSGNPYLFIMPIWKPGHNRWQGNGLCLLKLELLLFARHQIHVDYGPGWHDLFQMKMEASWALSLLITVRQSLLCGQDTRDGR